MKKRSLSLLGIVLVLSCLTACAGIQLPLSDIGADRIDWENIVLSTVLPEPQSDIMKLSQNDSNSLHADIYRISMNQFMEYIRLCEDAGFTIDANRNGSTAFSARHQDGYALTLTYNKSRDIMTVELVLESGGDAAPENSDALNAEEIYNKCASAVFYIEIYNKNGDAIASGSGVFISADGKALTNHHVVKNAYSAKVTTNDGKTYAVSGYYDAQESLDMALIQVDGSGFSFLPMGDSTALTAGQTVFAIGSPKGLDDTISQGIISNVNRVLDGLSYIQMTAPISAGSSGGALIDSRGQLIGLNTASYLDAQNLNLAVPIHLSRQLSAGVLHEFPVEGANEYTGASLGFRSSLNLTTGETGTVTISADPGDCPEDIIIEWECSDESIAVPEWDEWDEWDIDLHVYGKRAGTATITITLLTDSDVVLASKTLTVTVSEPEGYSGFSLSFNSTLNLVTGETGTVTVSADPGNCKETVTLLWDCSDDSAVAVEWDNWNGWNINLYATGKAAGTTTITIYLVIADTEEVLTSRVLTVYVTQSSAHSGASLNFNTALNVAVGETGTVTISANPGNWTEGVSVLWECSDETVITPKWDEWNGWEINLFVTGNTTGSATVTISLVTEDDVVLVRNTLTVTVTEMTRREMAFNKLRDWVIANANTMVDNQPAYYTFYDHDSGRVGLYLLWEAADNQVSIIVVDAVNNEKYISSIALKPSGDSDAAVCTCTNTISDEMIYGGVAEYYYATFAQTTLLDFQFFEGNDWYRSSASSRLNYMMCDGLDFTNWIFGQYIHDISIADFGFTNWAE